MRLADLNTQCLEPLEETFNLIVFSKDAPVNATQIKALTGANEARRICGTDDEEEHLLQLPRALEIALAHIDATYISESLQFWLLSGDVKSTMVRLTYGFRLTLALPRSKLGEIVHMTYLLNSLVQARDSMKNAEVDVRVARYYAMGSPISGQSLMNDLLPTQGDASEYARGAQQQVIKWLALALATQW